MRAAVTAGLTVGLHLTSDELAPDSWTLADAVRLVGELEASGLGAFACSQDAQTVLVSYRNPQTKCFARGSFDARPSLS